MEDNVFYMHVMATIVMPCKTTHSMVLYSLTKSMKRIRMKEKVVWSANRAASLFETYSKILFACTVYHMSRITTIFNNKNILKRKKTKVA